MSYTIRYKMNIILFYYKFRRGVYTYEALSVMKFSYIALRQTIDFWVDKGDRMQQLYTSPSHHIGTSLMDVLWCNCNIH